MNSIHLQLSNDKIHSFFLVVLDYAENYIEKKYFNFIDFPKINKDVIISSKTNRGGFGSGFGGTRPEPPLRPVETPLSSNLRSAYSRVERAGASYPGSSLQNLERALATSQSLVVN